MKTSVFSVSLLVAGLAFGGSTEITNDYVIGAMPLSVAANREEVVISIPWIEPGASADGVAVTNLVKTAGLVEDDDLYWYDSSSGNYKVWTVVSNTETHVQYWAPKQIVGESDSCVAAPDGKTLARGQALILKRNSETKPAITLYVVGGDGTGVAKTTMTMAAGTPSAPAYTLFAPPAVAATAVNGLTWTISSADDVKNDYILLEDGSQLKYRNNAWTKIWYNDAGSKQTDPAPSIPMGSGAWYVSFGGSPTVAW